MNDKITNKMYYVQMNSQFIQNINIEPHTGYMMLYNKSLIQHLKFLYQERNSKNIMKFKKNKLDRNQKILIERIEIKAFQRLRAENDKIIRIQGMIENIDRTTNRMKEVQLFKIKNDSRYELQLVEIERIQHNKQRLFNKKFLNGINEKMNDLIKNQNEYSFNLWQLYITFRI